MPDKRLRNAVRALVMDASNHILMVRLVYEHGAYWVLPGGGIDEGEDVFDALRRELMEETGLHDPEIGPHVWNRVHEFALTDTAGVSWDGQYESVHLVRTERFVPAPALSEQDLRGENLHEHRWWNIDEIAAYDGDDMFAPRDIVQHVRQLLTEGAPAVPFEIHQID